MTIQPTRQDVIAYRMAAHVLRERCAPAKVRDAVGNCGVQNSPPGSALLALGARVRDLTTRDLDDALGRDKVLLQAWCMRGAPYLYPASDASVFTTGVLPPTQEGRLHLIGAVGPALDRLGMSLDQAVAYVRAQMVPVLSGRRLAIGELGARIAKRVTHVLPAAQREVWNELGPYAAGQPWGEAVVHFCLRLLSLEQVVCFAPRTGNQAPFVLVSEWLGAPAQQTDAATARAELLRRYLHCYGPATRAAFAAWVGVRPGDVGPWWDLVSSELAEVDYGGTAWMLARDTGALRTPRPCRGVRLLPPRDPYTQLHDRATILAPAFHREVWRTTGEPGVVLVDGLIAATWRPRTARGNLTLTIRPFARLTARVRAGLEDEARLLAHLRQATDVDVVYSEP